VPSHRLDAHACRRNLMEIAAFVMCLTAVVGILFQFDERPW
jgi:hypothetical protein